MCPRLMAFCALKVNAVAAIAVKCRVGSNTLTTIACPAPCACIAASAYGIEYPRTSGPNIAASSADDTSVGVLGAGATDGDCTAHVGALPTNPITADLTTVTGTGPLGTSITSTPCRKLAGMYHLYSVGSSYYLSNLVSRFILARGRNSYFGVCVRDLHCLAGGNRTAGNCRDDSVRPLDREICTLDQCCAARTRDAHGKHIVLRQLHLEARVERVCARSDRDRSLPAFLQRRTLDEQREVIHRRGLDGHCAQYERRRVRPHAALLVALYEFFPGRVHLAAAGNHVSRQRGANAFDDRVRAGTRPRRVSTNRPSEVAHHDRDLELECPLLNYRRRVEQLAVLRALVHHQRRAHAMRQAPGLGPVRIVCDFDRVDLRLQLADDRVLDRRDVDRGRRRERQSVPRRVQHHAHLSSPSVFCG